MDISMMANNDDNQGNQETRHNLKFIFAEELVNFFLQKCSLPGIVLSTVQEKSSFSIFDNNFKMAADFISNTFGSRTDNTYNYMMANNLNTFPWFSHYANAIKTNFFKSGSYPARFLHYSVHLAYLAAKLYTQELEEAPLIAINNIIEAMHFELLSSDGVNLYMVAKEYAEKQRLLIGKIEEPLSHRQDESFVQADDQCEGTTETIYRVEFKNEQMDEGIVTISPSSSFQSQSHSEAEKAGICVFDHSNINPYNVSSLSYIGVPGTSSEEATHLHAQVYYFEDSNEDEKRQRKKPRLDHNI